MAARQLKLAASILETEFARLGFCSLPRIFLALTSNPAQNPTPPYPLAGVRYRLPTSSQTEHLAVNGFSEFRHMEYTTGQSTGPYRPIYKIKMVGIADHEEAESGPVNTLTSRTFFMMSWIPLTQAKIIAFSASRQGHFFSLCVYTCDLETVTHVLFAFS